MINNEIIIRQAELHAALATLRALQSGTVFRHLDPDDLLMNTSISETSDAVIEMYRVLQATEDSFQRLLERTIQAIEVAGVSFEQADSTAGQGFKDLPYAILL